MEGKREKKRQRVVNCPVSQFPLTHQSNKEKTAQGEGIPIREQGETSQRRVVVLVIQYMLIRTSSSYLPTYVYLPTLPLLTYIHTSSFFSSFKRKAFAHRELLGSRKCAVTFVAPHSMPHTHTHQQKAGLVQYTM